MSTLPEVPRQVTDPEATITIARDPDTALQTDWHPVRSDWSETFWLPIVGPTSYLLLRRFDRDLEDGFGLNCDIAKVTGVVYDWCALSASLGLVAVVGSHSPLGRTLKRIISFHLARYDAGTLLVPSHLPPLSYSQQRRLPDALKAQYAEVTR